MPRLERLQTEQNIWLATTRPDGRPHLVPIWFVWVQECFYICTEQRSVKASNLRLNSKACLALESGTQPIVAECQAWFIDEPFPDPVVAAFYAKYEWDINSDTQYHTLIKLQPQRWLMNTE